MSNSTDWLSAAAAAVSAVGGSFAAYAALLASRSARDAMHAADVADRRASRREIASLASAIGTEVSRLGTLVPQVKGLYRSLFALSSTGHNSRLDLYLNALDQKLEEIGPLKQDASLFEDEAKNLGEVNAGELDRVHVRLASSYRRIFAIHELVEAERDDISSQCAELRESMDRTRLAR